MLSPDPAKTKEITEALIKVLNVYLMERKQDVTFGNAYSEILYALLNAMCYYLQPCCGETVTDTLFHSVESVLKMLREHEE